MLEIENKDEFSKEQLAEMWIADTMMNLAMRIKDHDSICVGVSGGSDSNVIVHMIATYFRDYLPKIHFVFQNTGMEYRATLRHLDYMEQRYNIKIDRIFGESVVSVVKKYGVPIVSKGFSYHIEHARMGAASSIAKINRTKKESPFGLSTVQLNLANYIMNNDIKISSKCCDLSKKKPYKKYLKDKKADLTITGERRCEGGARAAIHKGCFESGKNGRIDKYMPLFYWDDFTKKYFKERENIKYSDCYEIWGMKRTGCVG